MITLKTMPLRCALATAMLALLAGCSGGTPSADAPAPGTVLAWVLPAASGSSAPDLSLAPDGRLLLAWMNQQSGRRPVLQFAALNAEGAWQSPPRTVAVGQSLVVNGADTPHVLATADGALWMQWLQRTGADAYGPVLVRSRDGGMQWSQSAWVSTATTPGEAGFAALWPATADSIGIAWLEGSGGDATAHAAGHTGERAMQLHAARLDMNLTASARMQLDARTCDCCQVAVARTAQGPVLAWRDRSDGEVRDIVTARFTERGWSTPAAVHADGWKIAGCPVNGPALAADQNALVLGWYTEGGGTPKVQLARSADAGATFAKPLQVDAGKPVLGRVAVALDAKQAWIAWLREDGSGQSLQLARYTPDLTRKLQQVQVARLQARGAASGVPKLVAREGDAWLVWTDGVDGAPDLLGARVTGVR